MTTNSLTSDYIYLITCFRFEGYSLIFYLLQFFIEMYEARNIYNTIEQKIIKFIIVFEFIAHNQHPLNRFQLIHMVYIY